jgi:glutaminyl-peptide cyclotransferase
MRRAHILVAAAFVAACSDASKPKTDFDGQMALEYARAQVNFGPRVPGTVNAQRAGDWIEARMRERADTVIVQKWTHTTIDGKQLPMRNFFARFRPDLAERVLYVTHWDSRPVADASENLGERRLAVPGANDGASGVGLFVALGDVFRKTPPNVGVDLLFVDGEDYGDFGEMTDVLVGSMFFAADIKHMNYKPIYGVLWDMIGDKDLRIAREPNSLAAAPEVVKRVWEVAESMGYNKYFVPETFPDPITDDHIPLIRAGLRVIDVIDLDYPYHHRVTDTIDKISAESLKIVGDVATALVTR